MSVTIELPRGYEESLRSCWGDLARATKEALVIESYRTAKIGLGAVVELLELPTRIAAQEWLAHRRIPLNYDLDDLNEDRATLSRLFKIEL
jgi:predicted HTH domain antitoxin